jgi:hypothetical protein
MAQQTWEQLLNAGAPWQTTAGTALTTATTATISPQGAGSQDFVLGSIYYGLAIKVTARGYITTTTTSTTATWLLAANQSGTYTTLATTAGIATGTTAITGAQWWLRALIQVTAIGSTGTLSTQGELHIGPNPATSQTVNIASAGVDLPMPAASGANAVTLNTFASTAIVLRATLAGANATIDCTQYLLESTD